MGVLLSNMSNCIFKVFFFVCFVSFTIGCGGGSDSGGKASSVDDFSANTPQEAMQKLAPEHRAKFNKWMDTPIKSCTSGEIFNEDDQSLDYKLVDIRALYKKNANSLILSNGTKVALMEPVFNAIGEMGSELSLSEILNGRLYRVNLRTVRSGKFCKVYLYDQLVYETKLASTVLIPFMADKAVHSRVLSTGVTRAPTERSKNGIKFLKESDWTKLNRLWFSPKELPHQFISDSIGILGQHVEALFKVSQESPKAVFKLGNEISAPYWNYIEYDNIPLTQGYLDLYAKALYEDDYKLYIKTQNFPEYGIESDKLLIEGTITSEAQISETQDEEKREFGFKPVSFSLESSDLKELSLECVRERFNYEQKTFSPVSNSFYVSYDKFLKVCGVLNDNLESDLVGIGYLDVMLSEVLRPVDLSDDWSFGGWDEILVDRIMTLNEEGVEYSSLLDSEDKKKTIGIVADLSEHLNKSLPRYTNLAVHQQKIHRSLLLASYYEGGLTHDDSDEILEVLDRVMDPFEAATLEVVQAFADKKYKTFMANKDHLYNFAKTLDSSTLQTARLAKEKALEFNSVDWLDELQNVFSEKLGEEYFNKSLEKFEHLELIYDTHENLVPENSILTSYILSILDKEELSKEQTLLFAQDLSSLKSKSGFSYNLVLSDINTISSSASLENTRFLVNQGDSYYGTLQSIESKLLELNYENNKVLVLLQKQTSLSDLSSFEKMLKRALVFEKNEKSKASFGSVRLDYILEDLKVRFIEQDWTAHNFNELEVLSNLFKLDTFCSSKVTVSEILYCYDLDLIQNTEDGLLYKGYESRYSDLAKMVTDYRSKIDDFNHPFLFKDLYRAYKGSFGDFIWKSCSNSEFAAKKTMLNKKLDAFLSADFFNQSDAKKEVTQTLEDCPGS